MKLNQSFIRWGSLALAGSVITLLAFTGGPLPTPAIARAATDTVPSPKRNADRDLDKELGELDKAKAQLEKMTEKDWDEIARQVEKAIAKIDFDNIQLQVAQAMTQVNVEQIKRQVQESIRHIDFNNMQREIDQVDKEAVKLEIEKAKKEVARVKEDLKRQQFDFKKEMDKASEEVRKAKEDMKGYQHLIYEMEKDGLLNTREDYSITYRSGELFINDKKQPQSVTDKYAPYFKNKNIAIKKQDGQMKINHQE